MRLWRGTFCPGTLGSLQLFLKLLDAYIFCNMGMYSFSIPAAINGHKLGGLQCHTFVLLQFWRLSLKSSFSEPKARCWQSLVIMGGSREESIPHFFQLLVAAGIPWLVALSLQISASMVTLPSPVYNKISLTLPLIRHM